MIAVKLLLAACVLTIGVTTLWFVVVSGRADVRDCREREERGERPLPLDRYTRWFWLLMHLIGLTTLLLSLGAVHAIWVGL